MNTNHVSRFFRVVFTAHVVIFVMHVAQSASLFGLAVIYVLSLEDYLQVLLLFDHQRKWRSARKKQVADEIIDKRRKRTD